MITNHSTDMHGLRMKLILTAASGAMSKSLILFLGLICSCGAALASTEPSSMHTLDYFTGEWACAGSFPASGKTITSLIRYESNLGGFALLKHHDDTSPPALYHAVEAWGYDAKKQQFNATILDNFGGARIFHSEGWKDRTLSWASAAEVQPVQRFIYVKLDERSYQVDWQVAHDGTHFVVGDTLTCKRQ